MTRWAKLLALGGMLGLGLFLTPAQGWSQEMAPTPGPLSAFSPDLGQFQGPTFCGPAPGTPPPRYVVPFKEPRPVPNAFSCSPPPSDCPKGMWYCSIGSLAYQRQRHNGGAIAVLDPGTVDTGIRPPATAPTAVDFGLQSTPFNWGVQAVVGYRLDDYEGIEVSGYFLPEQLKTEGTIRPGQLDLPFANFAPPVGFAGNNFLWLQADRVIVTNGFEMGSLEVNYRYTWLPEVEIITGLRGFYLSEMFSILTDDDSVTTRVVDPFRVADYRTGTINRIVGVNLGFDWQTQFLPGAGMGFTAKGLLGADFARVNHVLRRGDGFQGPSGSRNDIRFASVIELALYSQFWLNSHIQLRAGYHVLAVLNVPTASEQISFNPNQPLGRIANDDHMIFHGPLIEVWFAF